MKELEEGEEIQINDKICNGNKNSLQLINAVTPQNSYVRFNKYRTLKFPRVYTKPFRNSDESDSKEYTVHR